MLVKEGEIIRGTELAKMLGVTDRTIRNLATDGVLKKTDTRKYLFIENIQAYIGYIKNANEVSGDLKDIKIKEEIERIRKDTELKDIRIQELKNQLHPADVIEEVMTNMLIGLKGKLLSLSNKLAPTLIGMETLGEIQDTIHESILETLEELSEYDPELFKLKNTIFDEEELGEETGNQKNNKKGEVKNGNKKTGRPKKSK